MQLLETELKCPEIKKYIQVTQKIPQQSQVHTSDSFLISNKFQKTKIFCKDILHDFMAMLYFLISWPLPDPIHQLLTEELLQ